MNEINKVIFLIQLCCITLILSSCNEIKTNIQVLVPAEHPEATQYRRVAVLPFQGDKSEAFTSELEGALVNTKVDGRAFFTVAERNQLKKALDEIQFGQSGLTDPRKAARVGKMVNVKAIYMGRIVNSKVKQEYFREKKQECTKLKDPNKIFSRCLDYKTVYVPCVKKVASFRFTPKLVSVETGQVIFAKNIQTYATDTYCENSGDGIDSDQTLLTKAKNEGLQRFIASVAPTYINQSLTIMENKEGLTEKAETLFSAALEFSKHQRMDRACELWVRSNNLQFSPVPALTYNLGLCQEIKGQLDKALQLYQKADRLLLKPEDIISQGIVRVNKKIGQQSRLNSQR